MSVASIQQVKSIRNHPGADNLSVATVLGWTVVFNHMQHQYNHGDLAVYIEIDSKLPDKPEFDFLRKQNFVVRPLRLRGVESAGLLLPLSTLPSGDYQEGQDVSDLIGATHYEKKVPDEMLGESIGKIPSFIIKTNEHNLRSYPDAVYELRGREFYITQKDDGTSATFFWHNGQFGVCSREYVLKDTEDSIYWQMSRKYDMEKNVRDWFHGQSVAVQAELIGPEIVDNNNMGLLENQLRIFNVFFIPERTYGTFFTVQGFCNDTGVPMVQLVEMGDKFIYQLPDLIKKANVWRYPSGKPAEGLVIRPQFPMISQTMNCFWSGKVLSENYNH